jgi:NAD(P)-dependent dehydrogenase (short-subunit alcohol dehydrogenase family)
VVVNDLNAEGVEATAATIRDHGGRAVAFIGDVSKWDTGRGMVELALKAFGRLDVPIDNAGNSRPKMIVNMSEEDRDRRLPPGRHAEARPDVQGASGSSYKASTTSASLPRLPTLSLL